MENSTVASTNLATAKTVLSTLASVAGAIIVARSIAHEYLPHEFQSYIFVNTRRFFSRFSSKMTMVIDEFDGFVGNELYEAADVYLGSKITPSTQRLKVAKPVKEKELSLRMDGNEEIEDTFLGIKFKWILVCTQVQTQQFHNPRDRNATLKQEVRSFDVTFAKKHKDIVLQSYFPYIIQEAKSMTQEKKTVKIFTTNPDIIYGNLADTWQPMTLNHPSTFDTLALDPEVKDTILKDLDRFLRRKEYYRRVGKAWKRGYLLYGPPGTGKSSLIAAMANYLNFDVYDLELTALRSNSDLRRLLVATANRSILVVEDIDCSIEFQDRNAEATVAGKSSSRQKQVTLSGLLNFTDGLWSSCGDERLIIFTTNHKEKLDPALLRPGRMDVHVHMSYCKPSGFKVLASNYLGIKGHKLFGEIEELIRTAQVTPAEIAEQLMKGDDPESVLVDTIEFLKRFREDQGAKKLIESTNDGQEEQIEESADENEIISLN